MNSRILVVEDDNQIQELIVEFLSSQDYIVDTASDGIEGYEKFKNINSSFCEYGSCLFYGNRQSASSGIYNTR